MYITYTNRTSSWALVLGGGVGFLGFSPKPLKFDLAGAAGASAADDSAPSSSVCRDGVCGLVYRVRSVDGLRRVQERLLGWIDPSIEGRRCASPFTTRGPRCEYRRSRLSIIISMLPTLMRIAHPLTHTTHTQTPKYIPAQTRVVSCRRCCCWGTEAAGMKAATAAASARSSRTWIARAISACVCLWRCWWAQGGVSPSYGAGVDRSRVWNIVIIIRSVVKGTLQAQPTTPTTAADAVPIESIVGSIKHGMGQPVRVCVWWEGVDGVQARASLVRHPLSLRLLPLSLALCVCRGLVSS